jgi:hypothetical protein
MQSVQWALHARMRLSFKEHFFKQPRRCLLGGAWNTRSLAVVAVWSAKFGNRRLFNH